MRKLLVLITFLFLLPLPVLAADTDFTCTVCYNKPTVKTKCETLMSPTLEGVQQMIISSVESMENLDRVTVDCSFPVRSEKGYVGYKATFDFKK